MTPADPDADAVPADGRNESESERLDRHWSSILQELRVTQTGTQLLTGFLLTVAFQQRFSSLDPFQVDVYLVLVAVAVCSTGLGIAPVVMHRALFRQGAMDKLVTLADRLLRATLFGVALTLTGTTLLIFDVVTGRVGGIIAGSIALVVTLLLWVLLPLGTRALHSTSRPRRDA
jgi:hypothetical protein